LIDPAPAPPSTISSIAAILQAVAWPVVAALFFVIYRSRIGALLDVLTRKLATATKVKAWQLEIETAEQDVKDAVERAGKAAGSETLEVKIPEGQVKAAQEVNKRLQASPLSDQTVAGVAQRNMQLLVSEYDDLRERMPSSAARTRAMNEVVAKMRTLSLAARPVLPSFMSGHSAGDRLAAVCILQVVPEFGFFQWLVERIKSENQPFILFHSAVAILSLVKTGTYSDSAAIKQGINDALQHVKAFKGGAPDRNTIDVLNQALSQVR